MLLYRYRSCGTGKSKLVTNIHGPQKELAEYLIDSDYYTLNFHFIDLQGIIDTFYLFN